jgi:integrase
VKSFRTAWELAREKAGLSTVRFDDLRSEYASRLVDCGVPLSQVRDLLGHCSIIVTERYDRVRLDSVKAAVARLDDGQPFKILSRSGDQISPPQ